MCVQKLANSQLNLPHGTKPNEERVTKKLKTNKSSALAEMGDRGHNRHGPKGGGSCAPFVKCGKPV